MGNRMDDFAADTVYFLQVGNILHRDGIAYIANGNELGITDPAVRETDLMILIEVLGIGMGNESHQVRVLDDIERRSSDRCLCIDAKRAAHRRVQQEDDILPIEDHDAVADVIEDRLEPCMLRLGKLSTLLQRSRGTSDLPAEPVAHAISILETILYSVNNVIRFERRGQVADRAQMKNSLDEFRSGVLCVDQKRKCWEVILQFPGDFHPLVSVEFFADQ